MSVIDKKPFIETLLDSLTADELKTLRNLINGSVNNPIKRSLIYGSTIPLTTSDKGIKEANIRVSDQVTQQVYEGYLIYNDAYCVLIAYTSTKSQLLTLVDMHLANGKWNYEIRGCELSILELRSELNDRLIEAGAIVPENVKFTVSNIKALTDAECDGLKVGDMVAKKTGNQYHVYVVTYKEKNQGICLTYADASVVETQSYDYTAGHWVYNSEDKTDFSAIGGLPDVTGADNGNVLGVLDGSWAKMGLDGKFVRIINASDIPSPLTNEYKEIITNGCVVNGEYKGLKNPMFFPINPDPYSVLRNGIVIASTIPGNVNTGVIKRYSINNDVIISSDGISFSEGEGGTTSKITIRGNNVEIVGGVPATINGIAIPSKPNTTDIFILVLRKGTPEWYIPVAQDNITSGDVIALNSNLGKALIDHLEVEINGYRARYEYTSGNYVVYSSKTEVDSGAKLQVNMISYNTTNGELSFNQMTFTPDA